MLVGKRLQRHEYTKTSTTAWLSEKLLLLIHNQILKLKTTISFGALLYQEAFDPLYACTGTVYLQLSGFTHVSLYRYILIKVKVQV